METQPDAVAQSIEMLLTAIDQDWSRILLALVGVGIVTMALLQLLKDLLPTRRWFQRWWLQRFWFYRHADTLAISRDRADAAMQKMVDLATAGNANALFDLPVEQLNGQLNAAAQAMLDRPARHEDLLRIFAHRADPKDVAVVLKGRPAAKAALAKYVESRNSVAQQIQRSLDAIQIAMGHRWQWLLQGASVVVSAAIIALALTLYGGGAAFWRSEHVGYALIIAILGGFVAPVARDLVAAVQNLRARAR